LDCAVCWQEPYCFTLLISLRFLKERVAIQNCDSQEGQLAHRTLDQTVSIGHRSATQSMAEKEMANADRWLLPEGVEEILPDEAFALESLRRRVLDIYASWGYQLVITPFVEFLDSLLIGTSHDLDLQTFKVTDQLSGRMMGIRADMTPQVARIDAHSLNRQGPARLCYADSVLHTLPRGLLTSRVPIRLGAEFFGHAGPEADIELICLMLRTLQEAQVNNVHLVLGHVGIFRTLVDIAGLDESTEQALFSALQRKVYEEIDQILEQSVNESNIRDMLYQLSRLSGDEEILDRAMEKFASAPEQVQRELHDLQAIATGVRKKLPTATLGFDLCELRGYKYHTGIVFAAYTPDYGRAVAKGGRYDHIGEVFGRARPASGFDCDLKVLATLSHTDVCRKPGILAPDKSDTELAEVVENLRQSGEVVIVNFGVDLDIAKSELNCDRQLVKKQNSWLVEQL